MNKIKQTFNLISSMGIRPIAYRAFHVFLKKTGLLKRKYPSSYQEKKFIGLEEWRNGNFPFFFNSKESLKQFILHDKEQLKNDFNKIKEGKLKFFHGAELHLGKDYDWVTNPLTGFKYDIKKHWTEIETLDQTAGDIKYVWEKSRFCYLYTIIRYDYHFNEDQSEFVFSEIDSWIKSNPLNHGPNFTCSQELAIRALNWTFALYYYKNSKALTEKRFNNIINSIYQQAKHVESNINFSLLTVRNNHAITECLLLYTVGHTFPFFEESKLWKTKGKKLLEQEALYQIYEDGSYLQYSMNYERVVVQLFTWALYLSHAHKDFFSNVLNSRIQAMVNFLYQHQDQTTGMLPNYGANDGALFFPLNNCSFRDYRPQLNVLNYFFTGKNLYGDGPWNEDIFWFKNTIPEQSFTIKREIKSFDKGGYYILRDENKFSFIRCGSHPDRPSQADNLHLDIWIEGKNILRDAGSFLYNSSKEDMRFFMGTASHNTVMIDNFDQMLKGGRFLWFYWSQAIYGKITEDADKIIFEGKIKAFAHIKKNIFHSRKVIQYKNEWKWEIEDALENNSLSAKQIWNPSDEFFNEGFNIKCFNEKENELKPVYKNGFHSPTYGVKENSKQIIFESSSNYFKTLIQKFQPSQ